MEGWVEEHLEETRSGDMQGLCQVSEELGSPAVESLFVSCANHSLLKKSKSLVVVDTASRACI